MSAIVTPSKTKQRVAMIVVAGLLLAFGTVRSAHAMHISEGFLPPAWAILWFIAVIPFFLWGLRFHCQAGQPLPAEQDHARHVGSLFVCTIGIEAAVRNR